jgi:hypothetical protein
LKKQIAEIKQYMQAPEMKPHDMEPPTMKEIVERTARSRDNIKDFDRNSKGVSKEIMRKVKR